jgi:hypothetical protein
MAQARAPCTKRTYIHTCYSRLFTHVHNEHTYIHVEAGAEKQKAKQGKASKDGSGLHTPSAYECLLDVFSAQLESVVDSIRAGLLTFRCVCVCGYIYVCAYICDILSFFSEQLESVVDSIRAGLLTFRCVSVCACKYMPRYPGVCVYVCDILSFFLGQLESVVDSFRAGLLMFRCVCVCVCVRDRYPGVCIHVYATF